MRKLLVIAGLAFSVSTAFGQKLDDVKKDVSSGKYADARTKIDQVLSDPKNASNADAQFYKAVIYHNLAKANPQSPDTALSAAALEAMKKYMQMEQGKPEGQRALLSTLENNKTVVDIYSSYFNRGVENFKGNNFPVAFTNFEKALDAFDMLSKNNLTTAKFDTTVNLYAGYSAQNAKLYNQAAKYYDRLINANIADTTYVGIYRFMINNNLENKDTAAAKKYLALSQQRFPMYSDVWLDYQTLFLPTDKSKRFDEYQALVSANPKNETLAMNYAIELYNTLRSSEAMEKDPAFRQRAEAALKNVLQLDPNSVTGNLLISQFYWTQLYQLQTALDAAKGNTPAAVAKRKDINSQMDAVFDSVYPYLSKSYELYSGQTSLKPQDKANYRIVLGQLSDYYNRKKQPAKAAEVQAKLKGLQ
jgi:tetratricopeptide (TPR) repeat protein